MKAYKGFDKDMKCRGFQFEEGKTYEEDNAKLCECGFHACENPLDCFNYYTPGQSVFHEVEIEDVSDERGDDSKICGKKITIGAKLDVAGIVKAHFEYVTSKCKKVAGSVAGDNEAVSVKDRQSCSAGEWGSASAGYRGSASAGECGSASAGEWGSASAGKCGSASAGEWGSASAGECGSASAGEWGLAACRGGKVKGGLGCMLALCEVDDDGHNKNAKAVLVDGKTIKADVWYILKNGELVEVK